MHRNEKSALIVGSTGITGRHIWPTRLVANVLAGVRPGPQAQRHGRRRRRLSADLQDSVVLKRALAEIDPAHVFICTWLRQETEAENVRVNGAMVDNLFAALTGKRIIHAALVTGTKHYLGPFESYGQTNAETPFREDNPRLPGLNFYYTQEDLLIGAAEKGGFGWTVHRSHTVIGYAREQCHEHGRHARGVCRPLPGTRRAFRLPRLARAVERAHRSVTDARVLAEQLEWAATTPAAYGHAFNISNGDLFRWNGWLWPRIGRVLRGRATRPASRCPRHWKAG